MVGSVAWDVVPREQGSAGRLNIVRENNLTGEGASYPHGLKEELSGKKTGLAEQSLG